MSIKLWTTSINGIYLGSTAINQAYLWATEVFATLASNWLLNNLVSYYQFDTNGSFPDAHGSNTGTISGATYNASGKINWCYSFDNINDGISVNAFHNLTDFTYNIWVYHNWGTIPSEWDMPISKNWKWTRVTNGYKLQFNVAYSTTNADSISSTSFVANQWNMLTFTHSQTDKLNKIYLNGTEVSYSSQVAWVGTITNDSTKNLLFWRYDSWNYYWNWKLDEAWIWNRALSSTEISALYNDWAWLPYSSFTS